MTTMTQQRLEIDLCKLLQTMSIARPDNNDAGEGDVLKESHPPNAQDVLMADDPSYHSDATSECSSTSARNETYGCAYLRALQSQLESYPTTGGDYLEAIFTHREILYSYPIAHQDCARGFGDIAYALERRAWRADREADSEAVAAFRHEAWMIAATLSRNTHSKPDATTGSFATAPVVCIMQPVL